MTLYGRAMAGPPLSDEPPRGTVADDAAGRRVMEMRAEHGHCRVGVPLAEGAPGLARLVGVGVEMAAPVGLGHLHGAVHEVAGDHGLGAARGEAHADVAGRVTGSRLEPHLIRDAVI